MLSNLRANLQNLYLFKILCLLYQLCISLDTRIDIYKCLKFLRQINAVVATILFLSESTSCGYIVKALYGTSYPSICAKKFR